MTKEFVPYEQALALKELGFDESCFGVYSEHDKTRVYEGLSIREGLKIQVPLYQQAFRWFREKYELDSEIYMNHEYGVKYYTYLVLKLEKSIVSHKLGYVVKQNTYEEAELECLKRLIEISKN